MSIYPNPDIHTEMESMRTDIADLYLQLAERDTEIARMREAELHRAKSFGLALAERDAEVEDLNGRIVDLINDRDEMAKLARERLEELNELDAYLDKVCNERDEARTQVIALQTALEQVRAENEALRASFDEDDVYNEAHRLTVTADILSAFRDSIERLDDQLTKLETLEA